MILYDIPQNFSTKKVLACNWVGFEDAILVKISVNCRVNENQIDQVIQIHVAKKKKKNNKEWV